MIEKSDLRELVFRLEHARKSLIGPKFRALGLPLGQGQPRILNSLFKKQHVTQKELADSCFMDTTTLSRVLDRMTESGLPPFLAGLPDPERSGNRKKSASDLFRC